MRTHALLALGVAAVTGGCAQQQLQRRHPDLAELIAANHAENAKVAVRRDSALARSAEGRVAVGGPADARTLTVDVENVPVAQVLRRALQLGGQPFAFEGAPPTSRVTARFSDRPFVEGLNVLLAPTAHSAAARDGIISVRRGGVATAADSETVVVDVPVRHMDPATTTAIVDGFLRSGGLKVVFQPAHSVVMLQGSRRDVALASAVLQQADRAPGHVLLEALVVEFDVESLHNLGISFSSAQAGNFSEASLTPGNFGGTLLQFMRKYGVTNPNQFVAAIQAIAGSEKARIVARPYISARSGQPAAVEVGTNRVFQTQTFVSGGTISSSTTTVQSGVTLKITPTALPDDAVRVDLMVEEAQFIPTVGNAAAVTDRNMASTSMQVPSGQTIVIGGLILDRETEGNAGIPILRHIPIVNLFAGRREKAMKNQEVVIFITPHIWQPGMTAPLTMPDAFLNSRIPTLTPP
jgi:hypothetical protein